MRRLVLVGMLLLPASGGGSLGAAVVRVAGGSHASTPIASSRDDCPVVAVDAESDSISPFSNLHGDLTRTAEIAVAAEPRVVVLAPNGSFLV